MRPFNEFIRPLERDSVILIRDYEEYRACRVQDKIRIHFHKFSSGKLKTKSINNVTSFKSGIFNQNRFDQQIFIEHKTKSQPRFST